MPTPFAPRPKPFRAQAPNPFIERTSPASFACLQPPLMSNVICSCPSRYCTMVKQFLGREVISSPRVTFHFTSLECSGLCLFVQAL